DQWYQFAVTGLDSVTQSEVAALAEFALSGPGVVLGRALYRFDRTCITNLRYGNLLAASWNGLRPYLNRSLFHAALTRRGQTYTKVTASRRWTRTIRLVPFCMGQWERVSPSVLLLTHEGESCC